MNPTKPLSPDAQEYFDRNAPICVRLGTLTDADLDSFTLLADVWGKLCAAEGADTIKYVCLTKQYTNLSKLFGLDPVSRKKLGVTTDEPVPDEFDL